MAHPSRRRRRIIIRAIIGLAALIAAVGILTLVTNLLTIEKAKPFIVQSTAAAPSAPVAIVLGALVHPDGTPSAMMQDRLDTAVLLYRQGKVKIIDLSGDRNQVSFMTSYVAAAGVPAMNLLIDPAGFDTRDTMANARNLFHVQRALVCTQRFHLSRAVYIARSFDIDAIGVPADIQQYPGAFLGSTFLETTVREWGARVKAFFQVHF